MRRRSVLLAVPAGLVTLAGCGDEKSDTAKTKPSTSPSPSASASSAPPPKIVDGPLPAITAGTKFDEKPTVAKGSGDPSKDVAVKTVIAGSGKTVAENDYIQANYLGQVWDTAKVFDNSYDRKTPLVIQLAQGSIIDGWRYALAGKKAGSRVLMSVPPTWGYGKQGNSQAGIKGTDTLVFVVDIQNTFNAKSSAQGKDVAQGDAKLPKVGTNTDGKAPSIDVPKTAAPTKLVANYVIEGDGDVVKADSSVLVQYKGVLWDTGKEFDSTYSRSALTSFSLQQVVKGWSQGLTGKKVGSRVLIVVPPKLGYGDSPPSGSGIEKDSTLVFSVDILAKM
ncbi:MULTISPECIES: FKBP-type peptidyl-prolyl cis-trans isomerase [Streptomyces]|uniref:peptidylprolyl isomerase n=1 Tax=Streptomyces avermitilis (strain ATCC 31267 / DSM 46492 / JCM 5070 / NBRC 14893 / NCIMB 12804 / NRRL 8165 / MA-4680) TaxID=227882 RepID=Q828I3_STRAW|nr:FKBP-type peptidyl-prolyl cis-trans isomerase [Streptomyces avermitilis]MYT02229.1 FKBP-type peptidyl-prolyl cis-trans isomerase [Streptomyces sp. SID5469]KUN53762.1 peptidylprolyl isomerase [Streptomyces avermitilis]OOV27244.1 peptidylprolyl isomerase [Streptomyces avermitilis]BAC74397.1 putative FK-506 binding protein, peptidyl-prolyl cis-trans isomerase [Streptomyces avermitilis MA-4680 = NBRC 14893]GDY81918.1 peptidylprolyl isomerase [Streptomyces avermitilis]